MNRKLPPNMYARQWKTRNGYKRTMYYVRFTDWNGVRRSFPAGPDFKIARDFCYRLLGLNSCRFNFEKSIADIQAIVSSNEKTERTLLSGFFNNFRKPCVYVVTQGDEVLYVGASQHGVGRPFHAHHHVLQGLNDPTIKIQIRDFDDPLSAFREEQRLILELKPKFNTKTGGPADL